MALEIQNETIVGIIDNLQEKLNGELPINKLELLYLVNSWGRNQEFFTNENIIIPKCEATQYYNLSKLDTSEITNMSKLFAHSGFNGDISNWDVSNVTSMSNMFRDAKEFNQALNDWNVSKVIEMNSMFSYARNFNQDISSWNVSNVTSMSVMFYKAKSFNQDISNWNVSSVTNMNYMFRDATNFNQVLNWNVSNVTDMWAMFSNAIAFKTKFNNGNFLPEDTNELKQWLKENRDSDRMLAIDIKERKKDNLDSFYNNLESLYNNLDNKNLE